MNNQVEVRIGYRDDEKIVGELVKFFEPVAAPRVTRREETARKTWVAPITIILSIVGEWAAERYILDPLADRAEEWWKAIVSTWRRSKSKRRFNVTVQFDSDTNALEMEVSDVSDEETLKQVWSYVRRAHQISHDARERGTLLSKVRILSDGMQRLLVIGYERNRPRYVIDMRSGALQPIEPSADKTQDTSAHIWVTEQLIRRLKYLQDLAANGYDASEEEMTSLKQRIEARKTQLKGIGE